MKYLAFLAPIIASSTPLLGLSEDNLGHLDMTLVYDFDNIPTVQKWMSGLTKSVDEDVEKVKGGHYSFTISPEVKAETISLSLVTYDITGGDEDDDVPNKCPKMKQYFTAARSLNEKPILGTSKDTTSKDTTPAGRRTDALAAIDLAIELNGLRPSEPNISKYIVLFTSHLAHHHSDGSKSALPFWKNVDFGVKIDENGSVLSHSEDYCESYNHPSPSLIRHRLGDAGVNLVVVNDGEWGLEGEAEGEEEWLRFVKALSSKSGSGVCGEFTALTKDWVDGAELLFANEAAIHCDGQTEGVPEGGSTDTGLKFSGSFNDRVYFSSCSNRESV